MKQRYYSLDVFRGATVALMILVNNPGNWDNTYSPLRHAVWYGCTPTDLVFPFFLFAVGNAMSFVMPRFEKEGTGYMLKKVGKRTLLIFLIGLLLNWSPFVKWSDGHLVFKTWDTVRIMGVLQRIALSYFFASLIVYFFKTRWAFGIACAILLLYWGLNLWFGHGSDPYSQNGYFGTDVDITLFGVPHLYRNQPPFDPEGFASTTTAIVNVIFGYLVGQYIQAKGKTYEMVSNLFVAGAIVVCVGYCWDYVYPITKRTWSSSYAVYTTGLATITLALFIYWIECKEVRGKWNRFFDVFGKNPLFIYVLSSFLPHTLQLISWTDHLDKAGKKVDITPFKWFYQHICKIVSDDLRVGSLVYAISMVVIYWLIAYLLDKKKWYVKV